MNGKPQTEKHEYVSILCYLIFLQGRYEYFRTDIVIKFSYSRLNEKHADYWDIPNLGTFTLYINIIYTFFGVISYFFSF